MSNKVNLNFCIETTAQSSIHPPRLSLELYKSNYNYTAFLKFIKWLMSFFSVIYVTCCGIYGDEELLAPVTRSKGGGNYSGWPISDLRGLPYLSSYRGRNWGDTVRLTSCHIPAVLLTSNYNPKPVLSKVEVSKIVNRKSNDDLAKLACLVKWV